MVTFFKKCKIFFSIKTFNTYSGSSFNPFKLLVKVDFFSACIDFLVLFLIKSGSVMEFYIQFAENAVDRIFFFLVNC